MARKHKHDKAAKAAHEASRNGAAADDPVAEPSRGGGGGGGLGRLLFLLVLATILALVLSEDLRSKLLDLLFGAEEEFDYSSTTIPASDAPVGASTS
jgi:hypothetical protein